MERRARGVDLSCHAPQSDVFSAAQARWFQSCARSFCIGWLPCVALLHAVRSAARSHVSWLRRAATVLARSLQTIKLGPLACLEVVASAR